MGLEIEDIKPDAIKHIVCKISFASGSIEVVSDFSSKDEALKALKIMKENNLSHGDWYYILPAVEAFFV